MIARNAPPEEQRLPEDLQYMLATIRRREALNASRRTRRSKREQQRKDGRL